MSKEIFKIKAQNSFDRLAVKQAIDSYFENDVTITIEEGIDEKRSLSANALQAAWIKEIAEWQGESELNVRRYIKTFVAFPIYIEEETKTVKWIMRTLEKIGYWQMTPENQMNVVDMLAVTSDMTSKQHTRLRDQIKAHYANMGLILEVR